MHDPFILDFYALPHFFGFCSFFVLPFVFFGFFLLVKFILYVTLYTDFSVLLETF